jgi:chemotaxis protein MotB
VARDKKAAEEDEGPSQEWLASYADAMTLLLAFFIMMFAFALIDEGKFFDFKVGVVAALGVPDPLTDNTASILGQGTGNFPEVGFVPVTPTDAQEQSIEELTEQLSAAGEVTAGNADDLAELLRQKFELAGASEFVDVGVDERGVFIRFADHVLFDSNEADLDEAGLGVLTASAEVLATISNPLEIEGHTDNQPTSGRVWPSNWELSGARASSVVRWLIDPGGLPDVRLTAIGKADTKPVATNNTAEGRARNRRVEIVTRVIPTAPVDGGTGSEDTAAEDTAAEDTTDGVVDDEEASSETPQVIDDPTQLEDVITINPIENPVGIFPPPEDDTTNTTTGG